MWKGVVAFFVSLRELILIVREVQRMVKLARREGWIEEGRTLANKIREADSDDARRALVRDLAHHTSHSSRGSLR